MDLSLGGLRLLRTYADTGGLEESQCERTRTDAHSNRCPRHQAPGDDANDLTRQKAQFSQPPVQIDGGATGNRDTDTTRARFSADPQIRKPDVG